MPISFVTDSLDSVDEALKPYYVEKEDGKFHLDGDDTIQDYDPVGGLVRANKRNKDELAAVRQELSDLKTNTPKLPEDFDLEKWEKLKDGKADEAAQIKLRQEYEAKITDLEGKLTSTQETARKNAVERDLVQHLTDVGVTDKGLLSGALAVLSPDVRVDEENKPFFETDMGSLSIAERVTRWAAGEGKAFVDPGAGGGGKGGSEGGATGENPWKAESRNLMKQAEIVKTDPALAAQLKAAAGKS